MACRARTWCAEPSVPARDDGEQAGTAAAQMAAGPVRAGRASITWQRMRHTGRCTINVLGARHGSFARRAAPPGADRFAEPDVLRDALAAIECDLEAEHAAGDHWIVVGRVRRALRLS